MKRPWRVDPRVVFALTAYLSLFAVFARSLYLMGGLLALALAASACLRVDLPRVFARLKRLWQAVVLVALLQSLFSPSGAMWLKIGAATLLSSGGATLGLLVFMRFAILILGGSMFTRFSARELLQGMIQLRLPYEIAYMVSVGIRFIPMLGEELRDRLTALELRGVVLKELKMRKRWKVYTYLLLPTVAGCLYDARALAMSMEMRGFGAFPRRTSFFSLELAMGDCIALGAIALLAAATGASMLGGVIA